MDFSIQSLITSLRGTWQKLSKQQKILTVVIPLLSLVLLLSLVWWASRPDYTPLFQGAMQASEANGVVSKLKELKIPYQLNDGGTTILVPKTQVAEARLQLAGAGIPQGNKFSFDSLNTMRFGETDADRKLRYTLGLQDELETTLKTLAAVEDARVHLALPEQSLFIDNQKDSTAAVTLKLRPGNTLTDEQIHGIANLLSASIEGLKPDKVTIIDTNGDVLSDVLNSQKDLAKLSGSQLQVQQATEEKLRQSAQTMLDKALGAGKSIVRVTGTLDFDQVEIKKESYGNSTLRSKQNSDETVTNGSSVSGVPGGNSNIPGYSSVTGTGTSPESKKTNTQENYEIDKTEEHRVVNPGNIKKLSVSVLVDAPAEDAKTVQTVKDIVTSAIGVSAERGDQIQVAAIPFEHKQLDEERQAMLKKAQTDLYIRYGEIGVTALALLLAIIFLVRSRKQSHRSILDEELGMNFSAAALEPEDPGVAQSQESEFKQKLQAVAGTSPDEVAGIIKVWLQDETR